jgi:UDP-N-acetylmuramoyl-L-alanyl-D-glutamate--2,6-diaminopimelate ligase
MRTKIRKITPGIILKLYHYFLGWLGAIIYRFPANKLIVIGVTGTNGKSTVVNLIGEILQTAGFKIGWTSTINFKVADKVWLNDQKMTMLGRFETQKLLKQMVDQGCCYAIIETSSEGLKQHRHLGINYDLVVFTNLTPEHLESHGSFENYKKAKGKLFKHLTNRSHKLIDSKRINKITVINRDDKYSDYFLQFKADQKLTYSLNQLSDFKADEIQLTATGSLFKINNSLYKINLLGKVNIYNSLAAIAVARTQNIDEAIIKRALLEYHVLPGRFEFIDEGQNFKVMVDYAPEPESMKHLYETLKLFKFNRIIHILGSCGGGRDKARRPILGAIAAKNADIVIVTNEDPYDDDPIKIIDDVAEGAIKAGKVLNQNLFKVSDRREAIKHALMVLAQENDLILVTGKGSEQYMCVANGNKIPWDDRSVIRERLKKEVLRKAGLYKSRQLWIKS